MIPKLFLSQTLDPLVDLFIEEIAAIDPMETRTVLVPNGAVKQWLLLELAKRKGIAMGLKIVVPNELFPQAASSLERLSSLYSALATSKEPELISYFQGKKKRIFNLSLQLHSLFHKYGQYRSLLGFENTWQHELFRNIYSPPDVQILEPVICFGIDALPPLHWETLFKAPSLSVYLFSPCVEFWEDLCTDRERKTLSRAWNQSLKRKKGALDSFLHEGPRNLANWGKWGRETLRLFDDFEPAYTLFEPTSLLKQIQYDLLTFQETQAPKIDSSIRVLLTGSSRLREVEALRDEILRINIPYSDISVLAPDIEPYVPFIDYVFGDEIPYRISGFDVGSKSSFRQGLIRLLNLSRGRWDVDDALTLFETPAFYRKRGWDAEVLETFRKWIASAKIRFGMDQKHRSQILKEHLGEREIDDDGTWEKGLDALLDALIFLKPMQMNPDLFEELVSAFFALKELDLRGEKTLFDWAKGLEYAADTFLLRDDEDEADMAAYSQFRTLILEMKKISDARAFPLEVVQHFLIRPCISQIFATKLHAVRFAPIDEGALLPAKALFLIGMDEMSFPRSESASSLDLLKGKTPKRADQDRYRFLQTIFSAKEILRISYGHLSPDEGKPVGPSLVVQELLNITGHEIVQAASQKEFPIAKKKLPFPQFTTAQIPTGEMTLSLFELRQLARHPWRFYLQKAHQVFIDEDIDETFALQKGKMVRQCFEGEALSDGGLFGPLKEAMESEVLEQVTQRKAWLAKWQIEPIFLVLSENCREQRWEGAHLVVPALELIWDHLKVKLVGEIKYASFKGMISPYEDTISGTLKIWPEALALSCALNAPQIWMLRSGKNKFIANAYDSLKAFIVYYFHAQKAPSPLLPEWVDSFLRKGTLAKKIERGSPFEDPVIDWVFARANIPTAEEFAGNWGPFLKENFSGLIDLYPVRGVHANV